MFRIGLATRSTGSLPATESELLEDLPDDEREIAEERAAVLEFEAGMGRSAATAKAVRLSRRRREVQ